MSENALRRFGQIRPTAFIVPLTLLAIIALWLGSQQALNVDGYIGIQKKSFLFLNSGLSHYSSLAYNLTQIGDALVFLSLLSIFIVRMPHVWEALLAALVISVTACILKSLFPVPRPAVAFGPEAFVITGKMLSGRNSFPSGHSTTIFTFLTVLMFAFLPKKPVLKIFWIGSIAMLGLALSITRVAIGAHYPLDVIIGDLVGYLSGLSGIFISRRYLICDRLRSRKLYPVILLLLAASCGFLIAKMMKENLVIYYLALTSLCLSMYKIARVYVQK